MANHRPGTPIIPRPVTVGNWLSDATVMGNTSKKQQVKFKLAQQNNTSEQYLYALHTIAAAL